MKTVAVCVCLVLSALQSYSQKDKSAHHVIEGSKVVVELIKVLAGKKEIDKRPGCRDSYADICIANESGMQIIALLQHRTTGEIREMVIQPGYKECCLQVQIGVWTYDLKIPASTFSLRKGDLLIEGCQNLTMNIKY